MEDRSDDPQWRSRCNTFSSTTTSAPSAQSVGGAAYSSKSDDEKSREDDGQTPRPRLPSTGSTDKISRATEYQAGAGSEMDDDEDSEQLREKPDDSIVAVQQRIDAANLYQPGLQGEISKRSTCGLCAVLEAACRRLFGSELIEYDFNVLQKVADLGHGTFGKVSLVWSPQTNRTYALKAMCKALLSRRKLQGATRSEKYVMKRLDSPFLTKLVATFNRGDSLYIMMEACRGGDLHETYIQNHFWGSEEHTRFYLACVAGGLNYMHECRIIYRDIKMENVVLDARGYAKLCDFGLSRFLWPSIGSAYTICGTPEYKAPEIDLGFGYNYAADWWALGVLLYELMVGSTPFLAESAALVRAKAAAGIQKVLPTSSSDSAWTDLVQGLCAQEPSQRLPMQKGGVENIHLHPWYLDYGFDWDALHHRQWHPPYSPQLNGPIAVGHFNLKDCLIEDSSDLEKANVVWDEDYEDVLGPRLADDTDEAM